MSESTMDSTTVPVGLDTYVTVRDMDDKGNRDGGRFYLNIHNSETGAVANVSEGSAISAGWGQHEYKQRRQARRAAKALARRMNILYRQEKEYTAYREHVQRVDAAAVTV